jgi:Xaa-Pro aminopeptidase
MAWDSSPNYASQDSAEIELTKNMTLAYHALFHAEGEAGGVAIENTYRITETGCESLTKWPYEEIQIIGI